MNRLNHRKLTQVPRVNHDILDVLGRPQGSYAESFLSIYLLLGITQDHLGPLGNHLGHLGMILESFATNWETFGTI